MSAEEFGTYIFISAFWRCGRAAQGIGTELDWKREIKKLFFILKILTLNHNCLTNDVCVCIYILKITQNFELKNYRK